MDWTLITLITLCLALCFWIYKLEQALEYMTNAADSMAEALYGVAVGDLTASIDDEGNVIIDKKEQ